MNARPDIGGREILALGAPVRAVIFDLDGTLIDHASASTPALLEWVAELGLPGDGVVQRWRASSSRHYERYQQREITFQEQRRERVRDLLGEQIGAEEADELFAGYLWRYEAGWTIFPDAIACVEGARAAGLSLGILTNGERAQQLQKIDRFGLRELVDEIVCSSDLPHGKPHSSSYEAAVHALGHPASESLMVGDDVAKDARGALRAGLQAVLLDRDGTASADDLSVIASLDDLTFAA